MTDDPEIRTDRFGIPHHAYEQADGRFLLCKRQARLCKACKETGVPPIPADPYDVALAVFRAHWGKRWRELYRPAATPADDLIINPAAGAHIIALSDDGQDVTVLGHFGDDESVMTTLGALVQVHNDMIGVV